MEDTGDVVAEYRFTFLLPHFHLWPGVGTVSLYPNTARNRYLASSAASSKDEIPPTCHHHFCILTTTPPIRFLMALAFII